MSVIDVSSDGGVTVAHAVALGKQLAEFPQVAMLNDRRSVYESMGKSRHDALENEAEIGRQTWASGEGAAGAQSFAEGKGRSASFDA